MLLTDVLSRLRYQWFLVVLMLLVVEASPAFGAESQDKSSAQTRYGLRCGTCHGGSGKGDGWRAKLSWLKMPDFSDSAYMQTRSDDDFLIAIKQGRKSVMPSYGLELTEREIKDMVAYIRSFDKAPAPPKPVGTAR
ncbi:c-type cytochrome [Candidatus Methylomirabilis sp.]|uniref:c-type cytochrome n=1 Tax=Candidatus Methylomirabilis sp. TaxID=2032687 RepID=UPI003C76670D